MSDDYYVYLDDESGLRVDFISGLIGIRDDEEQEVCLNIREAMRVAEALAKLLIDHQS